MDTGRDKRIDLLGSLGAGFLGAGFALLFADALRGVAVPALLVGMAVHGGSMVAKGMAERAAGMVRPLWCLVMEWICWLLMAGLLAYVAWRAWEP